MEKIIQAMFLDKLDSQVLKNPDFINKVISEIDDEISRLYAERIEFAQKLKDIRGVNKSLESRAKSSIRPEVLSGFIKRFVELYRNGVAAESLNELTGFKFKDLFLETKDVHENERFIFLVDDLLFQAEQSEQTAQSFEFEQEQNSYFNDSRF